MPQFPKAEADIVVLADAMANGYTVHAGDFPNSDVVGLNAAASALASLKNVQTDAMGDARVATAAKNVSLEAMEDKMRDEIKKSEVDVGINSEKLEWIGWGPRSQPSPTDPPGQPRTLDPVIQGPGTLFLDWKPPARGSGGTVRTYVIERREQPAGGGEFGTWSQVGIALETETTLINQPRGQQLEYRVKGVNVGGESVPSNTAAVVL